MSTKPGQLHVYRPGKLDDNRSLATVDLSVNEDIPLGWSADLQGVYDSSVPGVTHLRRMPTIIPIITLKHLREKPPSEHRLEVVQRRDYLILQAIQSPTLVYSPSEYTMQRGFYRQAYAARDEYRPDCWILVVLSLAQLMGRNAQYHQVVTIHPANTSKFYNANNVLVARWMEVK